jgi:hypothetical protein
VKQHSPTACYQHASFVPVHQHSARWLYIRVRCVLCRDVRPLISGSKARAVASSELVSNFTIERKLGISTLNMSRQFATSGSHQLALALSRGGLEYRERFPSHIVPRE